MSKPTMVRIPSDECVITSRGEIFHPHEDEWVEIFPGLSVGELHSMRILQDAGMKIAAAEGDKDEGRQVIVTADDAFLDATKALASRIIRWNWTDRHGIAYPQPAGDPAVIAGLEAEEIGYLLTILHGETPEARKNGSRPSRTTSSATRSRRSRGS